jgi:hypothetical protein
MHQCNLIFSHCTVVTRTVRKLRKIAKVGQKVLFWFQNSHYIIHNWNDGTFFLSRLEIGISDLILKVHFFMLPCCGWRVFPQWWCGVSLKRLNRLNVRIQTWCPCYLNYLKLSVMVTWWFIHSCHVLIAKVAAIKNCFSYMENNLL